MDIFKAVLDCFPPPSKKKCVDFKFSASALHELEVQLPITGIEQFRVGLAPDFVPYETVLRRFCLESAQMTCRAVVLPRFAKSQRFLSLSNSDLSRFCVIRALFVGC